MVDDAHGTGVLGASGRGTAELCGCLERIDLQMGTLGKALGCAGAYLAASRVVIDILINRSRPFIFSTSLPPAVPASALAAIDLVDSAEGAQTARRPGAQPGGSCRRSDRSRPGYPRQPDPDHPGADPRTGADHDHHRPAA